MITLFSIDKIKRNVENNLVQLRATARALQTNRLPSVVRTERTVNKEFVIQLWVKKYKHILEYMDVNSVHRGATLQDSNITERDLEYIDHEQLREVFGMEAYPRLYEHDHSPNDVYSEWEWVEERSVIPSEWEDKGIRLWLGQDMIQVPMSESDTSIWGLRSIIPGRIDGSSGDRLLFKGRDFVEIDGDSYEAKYHIWEIE